MKIEKKYLLYYLSRALMAALFGWLAVAPSGSPWMGILIGLLIFAGFVYYLHSGRFIVDESHPLFPLRRDERSEAIHNKALALAVATVGLAYLAIFIFNRIGLLPAVSSSLALPLGVVVYFAYGIVLEKKG